MNNTFVTFSIGDNCHVHRQANFAAVSILAQATETGVPSIVVATDRPEYYSWLTEHVTVLAVDTKTLDDWRAPHGYFWRIKLRAMQRAHEESPGNLIYFDSDVACRAPLATFFASLEDGEVFMHKLEYPMCSKGGRARALWKQAAGRRFGPLGVDAGARMWNAGLVALPARLAGPRIAEALECLDAMCEAGVDSTLLDQLSLSLALDHDARLRPAEDWFVHYWGNKTAWNALIARFLADVRVQAISVTEVCERLRALPLDLPPMIKRKKTERLMRSMHKRVFHRDRSVVAQLTEELLG